MGYSGLPAIRGRTSRSARSLGRDLQHYERRQLQRPGSRHKLPELRRHDPLGAGRPAAAAGGREVGLLEARRGRTGKDGEGAAPTRSPSSPVLPRLIASPASPSLHTAAPPPASSGTPLRATRAARRTPCPRRARTGTGRCPPPPRGPTSFPAS